MVENVSRVSRQKIWVFDFTSIISSLPGRIEDKCAPRSCKNHRCHVTHFSHFSSFFHLAWTKSRRSTKTWPLSCSRMRVHNLPCRCLDVQTCEANFPLKSWLPLSSYFLVIPKQYSRHAVKDQGRLGDEAAAAATKTLEENKLVRAQKRQEKRRPLSQFHKLSVRSQVALAFRIRASTPRPPHQKKQGEGQKDCTHDTFLSAEHAHFAHAGARRTVCNSGRWTLHHELQQQRGGGAGFNHLIIHNPADRLHRFFWGQDSKLC